MKDMNGKKVNKKVVKKLYYTQCQYFGCKSETDYVLNKYSARDLYRLTERMFMKQPADIRKKFAKIMTRRQRSTWYKIKCWFKRLFKK